MSFYRIREVWINRELEEFCSVSNGRLVYCSVRIRLHDFLCFHLFSWLLLPPLRLKKDKLSVLTILFVLHYNWRSAEMLSFYCGLLFFFVRLKFLYFKHIVWECKRAEQRLNHVDWWIEVFPSLSFCSLLKSIASRHWCCLLQACFLRFIEHDPPPAHLPYLPSLLLSPHPSSVFMPYPDVGHYRIGSLLASLVALIDFKSTIQHNQYGNVPLAGNIYSFKCSLL